MEPTITNNLNKETNNNQQPIKGNQQYLTTFLREPTITNN
jgi:hypothetical protein